MCEPAHSIVQYDPTDSDDHFGGMDMGSILSKLGSFSKKVGRWFHISKMGAGHSLATQFGRQQLLYLPEGNKYEGFWWNKGDFHFDGWGDKPDVETTQAAEEYHKRSCIGSIQLFRRFLEESMKQSERPNKYAARFVEHILLSKAKDMFVTKVNRLLPGRLKCGHNVVIAEGTKERFIKLVMGFTRKRGLLVPEWSQDDTFWKV